MVKKIVRNQDVLIERRFFSQRTVTWDFMTYFLKYHWLFAFDSKLYALIEDWKWLDKHPEAATPGRVAHLYREIPQRCRLLKVRLDSMDF